MVIVRNRGFNSWCVPRFPETRLVKCSVLGRTFLPFAVHRLELRRWVIVETRTPGVVRSLPHDFGQRRQRIVKHVRSTGLVLGSECREDRAPQT